MVLIGTTATRLAAASSGPRDELGDATGAGPDRLFARSCVASAVALALAGDDAQAIYEALHAVDQPNELPQVVLEALR